MKKQGSEISEYAKQVTSYGGTVYLLITEAYSQKVFAEAYCRFNKLKATLSNNSHVTLL